MKTEYSYRKNTPVWMIVVATCILCATIFLLLSAFWAGCHTLSFLGTPPETLSELGQLGDFFGGHASASIGSLTLLAVLFFSYHTSRQQQLFVEKQMTQTKTDAERQFFLDGINLVTQWDIESSGCDQAMRLLDYYSRLALKNNDEELLLLINTVMTANIRKNMEGKNGSFKSKNYPFVCEAIERIRPIRERDGRAQSSRMKGAMSNALSSPAPKSEG